ncbi:MAG: hypothetical protein ACKPKO_54025, partial [Candidatus Fonsibacter sp.]
MRLRFGFAYHDIPEVLLAVVEHTGLHKAVWQPPTEDTLLRLQSCALEQPFAGTRGAASAASARWLRHRGQQQRCENYESRKIATRHCSIIDFPQPAKPWVTCTGALEVPTALMLSRC